jgi:hypothetical protein
MNIEHVKDCICNQVEDLSDYQWACCWGEVSSEQYYDSWNDAWSVNAVYGTLLDGRTIVNVQPVKWDKDYDEEYVMAGDCSVDSVREEALLLVRIFIHDLAYSFILYDNLETLEDIASKCGKRLSDDDLAYLENAITSYASDKSIVDLKEAYDMMVSEGLDPLDDLSE